MHTECKAYLLNHEQDEFIEHRPAELKLTEKPKQARRTNPPQTDLLIS